jgi:hypothetical protein
VTYDIIGDVHGELPALLALGRELGYHVDGDWSHPKGRTPVFLGDLVDRGAHSLEVAELVLRLVEARRGFCLMGNHEYNLVAWFAQVPGYEGPKTSNATTIAEITRDRERGGTRWARVLGFFRDLPLAVALPDLRLIHACWHVPSLTVVSPVLGREVRAGAPADAIGRLERHVVLRSPFDGAPLERTRLLAGIPGDTRDRAAVIPHEDLMKGFEVAAPEPFRDNYGDERTRIRALWWATRENVLVDRPQVFGHYWNLPPVDGHMAPPHPSGHPLLRAWASGLAPRVPASGRAPMTGDVACVDFHGVTKASDRACIGALRWPEREIVWATAPKTATEPERE